jgi:hypothetical protein
MMEWLGAQDAMMDRPTVFINVQAGRIELELRALHVTLAQGEVKARTIQLAVPINSVLTFYPAYSGVHLRDFHVVIPQEDVALHVPVLRLSPNSDNEMRNHLEVSLNSAGKSAGIITADIEFTPKTVVVHTDAKDVPAALLALLHPAIKGIHAKMDATIEAIFTRRLRAIDVAAQLHMSTFSAQHPRFYPEKPLQLKNIEAVLAWNRRDNVIALKNMHARCNDTVITLQGEVTPDGSRANIQAEMTAMEVKELTALWAENAATEARKWVKKRIIAGNITKADVTISHDATHAPQVDALLHVKDAVVRYADHLPEAQEVNGRVRIEENALFVEVDSARLLKATEVKEGRAAIPSFTEASVPMTLHLPLTTSAADVATFLSPKHLNKAPELRLRPASITGEAEGILTLEFPLYPERAGLGNSSFAHLLFTIKAHIKNVTQQGLLNKWDVKRFSGALQMDNESVSVDAEGMLQDVPITLSVKHPLVKKSPKPTEYRFAFTPGAEALSRFDVRLPEGLVRGRVQIEGEMQQQQEEARVQATIHLKEAELSLPLFGFAKAKGVAATALVHKHTVTGGHVIDKLDYHSGDAHVQGTLRLDKAHNITDASLSHVRLPHMDVQAEYHKGVVTELSIKGKKLDIGWLTPKEKTDVVATAKESAPRVRKNPLDFFLGKKVKARLDRFITTDKTLSHVRWNSDCTMEYCRSAQLDAEYGKRKHALHARIFYDAKGVRQFLLRGEELGSLVKGLLGNDKLRGGSFSLKGAFADSLPARPLKARLLVQNVTFVNAPILTQLLTLASLTGIADTLVGDGIGFDKIAADMTYDAKDMTLKKGIAKGDALGIMFEGTLSPFGTGLMDVKGTVIPSYSLNSLPSEVPLLGLVLAGEKGEGMFATRFSMRGNIDNPNILVNPLSLITPGFLRNIFDVFP